MIEQEIIDSIADIDVSLRDAEMSLNTCRTHFLNAETKLLEIKLRKERLVEELRVCRNTTVYHEVSPREEDIARFKERLPELMKKI